MTATTKPMLEPVTDAGWECQCCRRPLKKGAMAWGIHMDVHGNCYTAGADIPENKDMGIQFFGRACGKRQTLLTAYPH